MTLNEFVPSDYPGLEREGKISWKAPSNIALVKYWGKKENQIPANPSVSFTLNSSFTETTVLFSRLSERNSDFSFDLLLDGSPKEDFKPKIHTFFSRIETYLPFLKDYHFKIDTRNSFPHSSGIASSASGMSALALCLTDIERRFNPQMRDDFFRKKASFLARLGSGSASRSIDGGLVIWGQHAGITGSTDLFGIAYPYEVHPVFKNYQDTILLVHEGVKEVSSTVGHNLMHNHPFASARFAQAHKNLEQLKKVFKEGDLSAFIEIVESEALTLHAMMMTSLPYFVLMKSNTLRIIEKIWAFRKSSGCPICFTLDAGANVHLLYPEEEKKRVLQFVEDELVAYCENGHYICDGIGEGAQKIDV